MPVEDTVCFYQCTIECVFVAGLVLNFEKEIMAAVQPSIIPWTTMDLKSWGYGFIKVGRL